MASSATRCGPERRRTRLPPRSSRPTSRPALPIASLCFEGRSVAAQGGVEILRVLGPELRVSHRRELREQQIRRSSACPAGSPHATIKKRLSSPFGGDIACRYAAKSLLPSGFRDGTSGITSCALLWGFVHAHSAGHPCRRATTSRRHPAPPQARGSASATIGSGKAPAHAGQRPSPCSRARALVARDALRNEPRAPAIEREARADAPRDSPQMTRSPQKAASTRPVFDKFRRLRAWCLPACRPRLYAGSARRDCLHAVARHRHSGQRW